MFRQILVFFAVVAISIPLAVAGDIEGSSDYPDVGRFAGSSIIGYDVKQFDEFLFPEGLVISKDNKNILSKSTDLEGKITRILYLTPKGRSTLEVYKNYERKLKKSGFTEVFSCKEKTAGNSCGYDLFRQSTFQPPLVEYAYQAKGSRYISLKKTAPTGDIYISLMVYEYKLDYFPDRFGNAMVQLDVIEIKPLDDTQMVTADTISRQIDKQGSIALYGIYFDTGKAEIKPESDTMLGEIVKVLNNDNSLKLYVVGHTDNTGAFDNNMTLSGKRADAVVAALVSRGIDAGRLTANGVSSLAPVASNNSDEGRARNRRVELVAQ